MILTVQTPGSLCKRTQFAEMQVSSPTFSGGGNTMRVQACSKPLTCIPILPSHSVMVLWIQVKIKVMNICEQLTVILKGEILQHISFSAVRRANYHSLDFSYHGV